MSLNVSVFSYATFFYILYIYISINVAQYRRLRFINNKVVRDMHPWTSLDFSLVRAFTEIISSFTVPMVLTTSMKPLYFGAYN